MSAAALKTAIDQPSSNNHPTEDVGVHTKHRHTLPTVYSAEGQDRTSEPQLSIDVGISSVEVERFLKNEMKESEREKQGEMFKRETGGWTGYVEWESEKEKCALAAEVLRSKKFSGFPEFQHGALPALNPILLGNRWKQYHLALGPALEKIPAESWQIVLEEKHKDMLHVLDFPYNGEPPRQALMNSPITPNNIHFVRNHGGIPTYDDPLGPNPYSFDVGGLIGKPGRLTLAELQDESRFPQVEFPITLQCSGTRRVEQIALYPGEGDELLSAPWAEGAIGTARYKGVALRHVIEHFGGPTTDFTHVEFIGADTYFKKDEVYNYAVSCPIRKAMSNGDEVLLAWEMNGVPLPKIHGGPLRVVVVGYIGARSCKWLTRINILQEPSLGPVQSQEYLYFNSQIGKHNANYSKGFSVQDMPVSSALLFPAAESVQVHDGFIHCSGWAYSGGGRWIERVEVSPDGGFTWYEVPEENLSPKTYFTKRLWKIDLPVRAEGWLELVVRAWDNALNTQPSEIRDAWNWTLHVTSSAHRVKVYSVNRSLAETSARLAVLEAGGDSIEPLTRPPKIVTETMAEYEVAMHKKGAREPTVGF